MKRSKAVFIASTDTGVGKTVVTGLFGRFLLSRGLNAIPQKWIQTGGVTALDAFRHLGLMRITGDDIKKHIAHISPYIFKFAASPHLAALREGRRIDKGKIERSFKHLCSEFDHVLVEGIGGGLVPFNKKDMVIDIAAKLKLPVIIVAANRLGAINHTLLTVEAIKRRGMKILGVVFNDQRKKENPVILKDNIRIIREITGQRVLGRLPWIKNEAALYRAFLPIGRKIYKVL
ncbi:MAG: dethiobiotin synthase [Candidatus Omnitrophota bacterium]